MVIAVKVAKSLMNLIFALFKLLPVKHKVTIISRQTDEKTLDISLLEKELHLQDNCIEVVCLCKTIKKSPAGAISYAIHILSQMYHIATSKAVIIDGYCIGVSMLKQRTSLKVIQMWHALGSLKRFGRSILGLNEGRGEALSKAMNMHDNYDAIFASSSLCTANFAEAFGYDESYVKVFPLPRVDVLIDEDHQRETAETIFNEYPQLKGKKNIVYAPTFRKDESINKKAMDDLIEAVEYDKYNLIIKEHPLMKVDVCREGVFRDSKFSSIDMFCAADYIILDYSAIVYEAALMAKPMFFYVPDLEKYTEDRSFYIDYEKEMPGVVSKDASVLMKHIDQNDWEKDNVIEFAKKYVEHDGNCAENIAKYILGIIN